MSGLWIEYPWFILGVVLVMLGSSTVVLGVLTLCGRRSLWPKVYLLSTLMGGGQMPGGLPARFVTSNITDGTSMNLVKCLLLAALGAGVSVLGAYLCRG